MGSLFHSKPEVHGIGFSILHLPFHCLSSISVHVPQKGHKLGLSSIFPSHISKITWSQMVGLTALPLLFFHLGWAGYES